MDSSLFYRHMFTVPKRTIKTRKFSLWIALNTLLWKGKIVQDTPEEIVKALTNQSEVSIQPYVSNCACQVECSIGVGELEVMLAVSVSHEIQCQTSV